MERIDKKYIVKKLLKDALSEEDENILQASFQVRKEMEQQWEYAPDRVSLDCPNESAIWRNVSCKIWSKRDKLTIYYRIYCMVASFLLLIGLVGFGVYVMQEDKQVPMYVVSSGIQNMESITLPDGTIVQMGPKSRLTYPIRFQGKSREIYLSGQAFFDVSKDPEKPFIVHTKELSVEALGTAFELFCYDIEDKKEAILLDGKIKLTLKDQETNKNREVILNPDEKVFFDKQTGQLQKLRVDADKYTAWRKRKILSFENEKLSMIIPRLEQWYGRNVICQKDLANKYRFTFKVRDESLDRILLLIQVSSPLQYKETADGNYILTLK